MDGCLLPVGGQPSLCTYDDFCLLARVDLMELGLDLPEGAEEKGPFCMFVQQALQEDLQVDVNVRAWMMCRQPVRGDVLLVSRGGDPLTLGAWRAFLGRVFPMQRELEAKEEKRRKKAEACSVQ
jgi:hypothetical protein